MRLAHRRALQEAGCAELVLLVMVPSATAATSAELAD
jgi:hypothetical protein